MFTNPNQKVIQVHKSPCDKNNLYSLRNIQAECAAAKDLHYSTMILWLYLSQNQDNYKFAMSPMAIEEAMGLPRTTYPKCVKELEQKGYLIKRQGNYYDFYESPQCE